MNPAWTLSLAALVPLLCLGLLLVLARLEDTLTDGLDTSTKHRAPAPVPAPAVAEASVPAVTEASAPAPAAAA